VVKMINKERLFKRLQELGMIGKRESGGITRHAFTREDRLAKDLVISYMKEAGLSVREDAVGNLIGRREGRNPDAPVILTGSHIDSVCDGGIFDGGLGILGGIEVLQTLAEQGIETEHPIEVYAFNDEEGSRFSFSMFGSRGVIGDLKPKDLDMKDKDGITVAEAMKAHPDRASGLEIYRGQVTGSPWRLRHRHRRIRVPDPAPIPSLSRVSRPRT
jgi:allantoate deiminase